MTNSDMDQQFDRELLGETLTSDPDDVVRAVTTLDRRVGLLEAENRDLAGKVRELHAEHRQLRSRTAALSDLQQMLAFRHSQVPGYLAGEDERRRLERDLHDGVQNELVALIVKLSLAEQDPDIPPAFAGTLSELTARAQTALDSVREIARGIYPPVLDRFGVLEALRAQAARASIEVRLAGAAPRSTEEAEAAVYFSCLEAIQNVARHAGRAAQATLQLHHDSRTLAVRIEDNGCGFAPAYTHYGAGLRNIHDRIQTLGGMVNITSSPGRGTLVRISLPWPPRQPNDSDRAATTHQSGASPNDWNSQRLAAPGG